MSWIGDHLIRQAVDNIVITGSERPYLTLFPARRRVRRDASTYKLLAYAIPNVPNLATSPGCTFETDRVWSMYLNYSTNTGITLGGWAAISTYSLNSNHYQALNPPIIPIALSDSLEAQVPAEGWLHIITKEGWLINGVSYPSAHICCPVVNS